MAATQQDLVIEQGKTFTRVVRWETTPLVYKPITAIPNTAPATLTVAAHGMPDGWKAAVTDVKGMTDINAANTPPKNSDFMRATVVDANTVAFNAISAASFKTYKSGGYLVYYTPVDLTGFTAAMKIKDRVGGNLLISLVSPTNIVIDATGKTITVTIGSEVSAAFTWLSGVYDLEMISPTGVVTALLSGAVAVTDEVTT